MPSENNKRIAKNTLMLYVRMFFTMLVGFYTSRVVLNVLGVTDYGIYNVVGGIVNSLALLNGSMASATQRWITVALGKNDEEYLKKVFGVGLTAQLIMAGLVLLLVETVGLWYLYTHAVIPESRMNAAFWTFQISTFTLVLSIVNVPFQGAIIAHEKMGTYALFSIIDIVMKLVICFALYVVSFDKLIIYSILLLFTFLLNFMCIQLFCRKKFIEARSCFMWDKVMYRDMWKLAFWNTSENLAYIGYSQGTILLINLFFGPAMNAAAGIATQAAGIINRFSINFQMALNPQITKTYAQGNYQEMHKLIFRSSKFSCFMMLFLAVPLFYEAHFLLKLWLGNVPEHTLWFMRLGLFSSILMAIRNPLKTAALANGNLKKYQFVVNGILLLICPVLYIAYSFGAVAEISELVISLFIFLSVLASAYMLRNMVLLDYHKYIVEVILKIVKISILCCILPGIIYFTMPEGWLRLCSIIITSFICTFIIIYYLGLECSEKMYIKDIVMKCIPQMRRFLKCNKEK